MLKSSLHITSQLTMCFQKNVTILFLRKYTLKTFLAESKLFPITERHRSFLYFKSLKSGKELYRNYVICSIPADKLVGNIVFFALLSVIPYASFCQIGN